MRVILRRFALAVFAVFGSALAARGFAAAPLLEYRVVAEHAHDSAAFTQGLALRDGLLFESSGGYGRSGLSVRRLADGQILRAHALPPDVFGEGLALVVDRIVQLSWQSQLAFLYSLDLKPLGRWHYRGEGWGLAYDGAHLIRSDGSDRLRFHDPHTFAELGGVQVRDGARAITRLNELEYAEGRLYANVWLTDRIAVIDPAQGSVQAWLDLSALKQRFAKPPQWNAAEHVLNGIAYEPRTRRLLVTGKCWPRLFELEIGRPPLKPGPQFPSN